MCHVCEAMWQTLKHLFLHEGCERNSNFPKLRSSNGWKAHQKYEMKPTDSNSVSHNYNFWVLLYWQYVTGITAHCKLMLRVHSTVPDKQFTQTL